MFKKSRRKIVVAIMSILVILWVGTLSVIYASSYFEMKNQNEQMLKVHAEMYNLPQAFDEIVPPNRPFPGRNPGFAETPMFQLSTFYSVAVSYDGEILDVKNDQPTLHTEDDLVELAQEIIEIGEYTGTKNNLAFYREDKNGYTLVVFKDNTVINEGAMTLFRYTLIFGGVALILFFFLSIFLARKIVNPLEESYHKQKCRFTIDVLQKKRLSRPSLLTNEIKMQKMVSRQRETQEQKVKRSCRKNIVAFLINHLSRVNRKRRLENASAQNLRTKKIANRNNLCYS